MESTLATVIKIAKVSQELIVALRHTVSSAAHEPEVSRLLFWLDKMVTSSRVVLEHLNQHMIDSTSPDEQLGGWISANGPVISLLALNEMKKTVDIDNARKPSFGYVLPSIFNCTSSEREKIHELVKVFDNHRAHFDYLLMSDVRDYKMDPPHQATVAVAPANLYLNPSHLHAFGRQTRSEFMTNLGGPPTSNELKVQVDLESLDAILRWLDAFRCIEKHVDTLLQRQSDTCAWLLETTQYKEWLTAGDSSFLWLYGKAGSGKSVLMASTIDHMETMLVDIALAFFYCDFAKEESTDATQVVCSLLYQFLDHYRHGRLKSESGALEVMDELVVETHKGDAILKNVLRLSSLLSRVIAQFRQLPLIIVDALDECRDVDRLVHVLLLLKTSRVRLLVSSRPIQAIKHRFNGLPSISMDNMAGVSADIELHINREVDSHRRLALLNPTMKRELCSTLCQKADGMFRWVQCQLDALKACITLQEFQETLNNLPAGLEATYERILRGIDQRLSEGQVARRALMWLVTASRPLILAEMVEALSIDPQKQKLNPSIAPIHKHALLDILGSLVVHNEETDIVNLSHFSVKEYLMGEPTGLKLPSYRINLREAHKQVFQLCMCYLSASLVSLLCNDEATQSTEHAMVPFNSMPSLPLLDYVLSCGFDHLAQLEPTDDAILDSMVVLQTEIQKHPLEWKRMCRLASLYHAYKSWITPEHDFVICVLISMLPEPFLRAFLNRIPPKTKFNLNPLTHTVHFNKVDHARTLLLRGVDVNYTGCDAANASDVGDNLPLLAALHRGNAPLVDLFLSEGGAAIPGEAYQTIFRGSPYAPHLVLSLLQADEFVEWAAKVQDADILSRPLYNGGYLQHQATEKDLVATVRRLAQIGHDFSSQQFFLMVASATEKGHLSLLEYLFSIEAPIPSGILLAEKVAPLIRDLALRGINIEAVVAKGDVTLRQVLGRQCFSGGSRSGTCWMLDCFRCSTSRSTLLTTFGREDESTLVKITTIAKELKTKLCMSIALGHASLRVDIQTRVTSQLNKIHSSSGTLLQSINQSTLRNTGLDHDSKRWLSEKEPETCLKVLQQMVNLAEVNDCGLFIEKEVNTLITLFDEQQNHFQFLLETADAVESELSSQDSILFCSSSSERMTTPTDDCFQDSEFTSSFSISGGKHDAPRRHRPLPSSSQSSGIPGRNQIASSFGSSLGRRRTHAFRSDISPCGPLRGTKWKTNLIFVGQTGVGKSSLINMIMGIPDHWQVAARVGRGTRAGTLYNTRYLCTLMTDQECELWDTRGLSPVTDDSLAGDTAIRVPSVQFRRLILVWCIHAANIGFPIYWQQLREVYKEYDKRASLAPMLLIVVTQMAPHVTGWEATCNMQIRQLNILAERGIDISDFVLLLRVRRYRGPSSPEYIEDAKALRYHISHYHAREQPPLLIQRPASSVTPSSVLKPRHVTQPILGLTTPIVMPVDSEPTRGRPAKKRRRVGVNEEFDSSSSSQTLDQNPDVLFNIDDFLHSPQESPSTKF